jgi:Fic family protein
MAERLSEKPWLDAFTGTALTDEQGRYFSWDEFKRRPVPPPFSSAQEAWCLLKLKRLTRSVTLPLEDKHGRPFSITEAGPLRNKLHKIDRDAAGRLSTYGPIASPEEAERQHVTSLIEEPYSSSVYEGAVTTRERAKELIREGLEPTSRDDQMVLNNYRAMEFIKEQKDEPLTLALILELHEIVTRDTLDKPDAAGRLRRADERIGMWYEDELVHEPPHADELQARLQRLCDFANEDYQAAEPFLNPIIRAIMLHFMIGYDHPFCDGNGRTARALFYWYALRQGYWLLEYVSISKVIREESGKKYELAFLNAELDESDATYFVLHQLDAVLKGLSALQTYFAAKAGELDDVASRVSDLARGKAINLRQVAVLTEAARHSARTFTVVAHQAANGVVYLTARKDLEGLVEQGWMRRTKNGRQVEYRAADALPDLLTASPHEG